MDKVVQIKKNNDAHGFIAIYKNGDTKECECYHGGEKPISIGDIVWDSRVEEYINIETQRQIDNYYFVAPELYIVAKLK